MIYDMQDIAWLRKLRTGGEIAEELLASHPGALNALAQGLVKQFIDDAKVQALDVDDRDLRVEPAVRDPLRMTAAYTCWWETPEVHDVLLVDGPKAGTRMVVRDVGGDLKAQELRYPFTPFGPAGPEIITMVYRVCGWDTKERHWLMSASR